MDTIPQAQSVTWDQRITSFLESKPVVYQFLRFACIGVMNTALNFLLLNAVSKALGVSQGLWLGIIDIFTFAISIVQSYLWNRTWTFGGEQGVTLMRNVMRLILVGLLGSLAVIFVLVGSHASAPWWYYFSILVVYLIVESVLWRNFGFHLSDWHHENHSFFVFFTITFVGLGINVSLVAVISHYVHLTGTDLDKNIATILATCVSLFWNFIGYKVVVFKK